MGAPVNEVDDRADTTDEAPHWHALDADEVGTELDTDPDRGLDEAEVTSRRERYGRNELEQSGPRPWWSIVLHQFASPLIYILLVALVVTLLIDEYLDALMIAIVLTLNAVLGSFQERKADRSVHALLELASPHCVVVRQGSTEEIDAAELVPGDVVELTSGSRVPADLRLVRSTALDLDESMLTGESLPVRKTTDPVDADALASERTSMAHMGSAVASGRGRGIVVATGAQTQLGRIAESISSTDTPATPLQQRMGRFANIIAVVSLGATAAAFGLGVAMGGDLEEMFLTAVALAVAIVPEGLVVAMTVALALGVNRMARRHALIRSLPAVETLGSTELIGSDKTGTLTQNQMTVLRGWTPEGWVSFDDDGDDDDGDSAAAEQVAEQPDGVLAAALVTAVLSTEATVRDGEDGPSFSGDPTETALLDAAHRAGVDPEQVRERTPVLARVPFESDLRYSMVVTDEDGALLRLTGAPERVLDLSSSMRTASGDTELDTAAVEEAATALADRGLRVLATAELRLDTDPDQVEADDPPEPGGLVLTGLVGMQDPPRHGVRDAIGQCRSAGIRVVMVTGDHAATAKAIARDVGIGDEEVAVVTGHELEGWSDDELRDRVLDVDVFARVAPEHKLRVVQAVRSHQKVVAVTGDGVNDGPALKAADIGVAMGRSGTDVAREASDMVLTDDNFVSIVSAVEEGRAVFDNVRNVTYYLLATGVAAIVAILVAIVAELPLPFVPAALLWLNVVTAGVQDVALAFERGEPDVLDRPPRRSSEGIVNGVLWRRVVLTGTFMAVGSLWLFHWAGESGLSESEQRGAALTTLVVAMAAHVYTARSERRSVFSTGLRGNRILLASTVVALAIHVVATYLPPMQALLRIEPVTAEGWARIAVVVVVVVAVSELHKLGAALLERRRGASPTPQEA